MRNPAHPDPELDIFPSVDLHAFVQQADLLEVLPVHNEAANEGRAPAGHGEMVGSEQRGRLLTSCQEGLPFSLPLLPKLV